MGFMDKAKKLADQVQKQVNDQMNQRSGSQQPGGPVTQYDQHGRPIAPQESTTPPHGDPLAGSPAAPPAPQGGPKPDPAAPGGWSAPAPPTKAQGAAGTPTTPGVPPTEPPSGPPAPVEGVSAPPPMPGAPGGDEDRNRSDYAPPKMTGGDPLAG